jgi:hypothetical protein
VHATGVGVPQLPAPLQVAAGVADPAMHEARPQGALGPEGNVHALVSTPLHEPAHGPLPAQEARLPTGGPVTGLQVPSFVGRLHAWHWPAHATSQQTLSTHWPVTHWLALPQAAPLASLGAHWWAPVQ